MGHELLLHFADFLLSNYSTNAQVRLLLDNARVHLMPSMNPDGYEFTLQHGNKRSANCVVG